MADKDCTGKQIQVGDLVVYGKYPHLPLSHPDRGMVCKVERMTNVNPAYNSNHLSNPSIFGNAPWPSIRTIIEPDVQRIHETGSGYASDGIQDVRGEDCRILTEDERIQVTMVTSLEK